MDQMKGFEDPFEKSIKASEFQNYRHQQQL